jgi:hypothetical protein
MSIYQPAQNHHPKYSTLHNRIESSAYNRRVASQRWQIWTFMRFSGKSSPKNKSPL